MTRTAEAVTMFALFLFVFFAGVKYSDSVKTHVSWMFEKEEIEAELPELKNSETIKVDVSKDSSSNLQEVDHPSFASSNQDEILEPEVAN